MKIRGRGEKVDKFLLSFVLKYPCSATKKKCGCHAGRCSVWASASCLHCRRFCLPSHSGVRQQRLIFGFFPQQKIDEYASPSGAEDGSGKYTKNWPLVEARRDCSTFIPPWPRAVRCVGWHVHRENAIGAPSGQCGVSTSISALSSVFQVFFRCFSSVSYFLCSFFCPLCGFL